MEIRSTSELKLSLVVPVLNDAGALAVLLSQLRQIVDSISCAKDRVEILVVDGGSADASIAVAKQNEAVLLVAAGGRGGQLHAGALAAGGEWIWLLHADSRVKSDALTYLLSDRAASWGRFNIDFDSESMGLKMIARFMNWRSKTSGICTGDQGIFLHRSLLQRIGGIPRQPLMEDIELSRRLKRLCHPLCPSIHLTTSARRWLSQGAVRTVFQMWLLRLRYWAGSDPRRLSQDYYAMR